MRAKIQTWARANQKNHKEWHHQYGMFWPEKERKNWVTCKEKHLCYQSKIVFTHLLPLFSRSLSLSFQELLVQSPPPWWVQTTWGIGRWNMEARGTWQLLEKAQETRRLGTRTEGLVNQLWTKVLRPCLILILHSKRLLLMRQGGKLLNAFVRLLVIAN